jgi:3-deoxy-D-manno-octulosonic-acid transferase
MLKNLVNFFYNRRIKQGKEDPIRISERFGVFSNFQKPQQKTIWLHAVSVGEFNSCVQFISQLIKKGYFVVCTTNTLTSAKLAKASLPTGSVHCFSPCPMGCYVKKFLQFWQPEHIFFTESEIWPAYINESRKFTKNVYLINARISQKSFKRWRVVKPYISYLLTKFKFTFASTEEAKVRIEKLTPQSYHKNIFNFGYTKFDIVSTIKDEVEELEKQEEMQIFSDWVKKQNKNIITYGSLHLSEVEVLQNKIANLARDNIQIIALRHIHEVDMVTTLIKNCLIWSDYLSTSDKDGFLKKENPSIFVIDKIGLLKFFYSISNIVVIGGSFVDGIGGHNAIEPLALNVPTVIGNFYAKCSDIISEIKTRNAIVITDKQRLDKDIEHVLNNDVVLKMNIASFMLNFTNTSEKIIQHIQL